MFKALLMIVGLLVLSIVGIASMGWWKMNQTIDPASESGQTYAANFKAGVAATCAGRVARELGIAARGNELADMCECTAEMTYAVYKNESPAKLLSLASDPAAQRKVGEIVQECADRAGLQ
jgi:hypothetical protein